ncbi:hypothetical protein SDC9_65762 [bioreactor metagenome]|uniref:Uncharacterized protein n=1 Tax=bioreactor metagenome TaxID=1076179 RepID=A0A644XTC5_9ZZZZ
MGDIDDDFALFPKLSDNPEKALNLRFTEACRGLIKADDPKVVPTVGLHDLDHLLVGNGEVLDQRGGFDGKTKIVDDGLGFLVGKAFVDNPESVGRHSSQIDVLCYTEVEENLSLLVDDAYPIENCLVRVIEVDFFTVDKVSAFIGLIVTIENLQKS